MQALVIEFYYDYLGIEASDMSSLLEQFLEYEQGTISFCLKTRLMKLILKYMCYNFFYLILINIISVDINQSPNLLTPATSPG